MALSLVAVLCRCHATDTGNTKASGKAAFYKAILNFRSTSTNYFLKFSINRKKSRIAVHGIVKEHGVNPATSVKRRKPERSNDLCEIAINM